MQRGARSVTHGVAALGTAVKFCVTDAKDHNGSLLALPLALLLPIDGVLRGVTEVLLGTRNTVQPEARAADARQFKGGRRPGGDDRSDDDEAM